ncbi:MAG: hypothetical protein AAFA34_04520 [Thermoplasmata archaeon]|jgi:hypothetical protein
MAELEMEGTEEVERVEAADVEVVEQSGSIDWKRVGIYFLVGLGVGILAKVASTVLRNILLERAHMAELAQADQMAQADQFSSTSETSRPRPADVETPSAAAEPSPAGLDPYPPGDQAAEGEIEPHQSASMAHQSASMAHQSASMAMEEMEGTTVAADAPLPGYESSPAAQPAQPLSVEELVKRHAARVHTAAGQPDPAAGTFSAGDPEVQASSPAALPGYEGSPAANPAPPLTPEQLLERHNARARGAR